MGEADKLINKISECQHELKKIQDNCTHVQKEVKFINPKEGVRLVCVGCKSLLGWPTQFEVDRWVNK